MMIFGLMRKMFNGAAGAIDSVIRRVDKKSSNPRGYIFGSPKGMRVKILIFVGIILVGFVGTVLLKKGALTPVSSFFEKETAPGAKIPVNLSRGLRPQDMLYADREKDIEKAIDCDRLRTVLMTKGALNDIDRTDFEKHCKKFLSAEMQDLVDTLLNSDLAPDVIAEILKQADDKNASDLAKLVRDDKFKEALRSDGGKLIAQNLSTFSNMSAEDAKKSLDVLAKTPPQFRADAMKAITSIANLKSPEARAQMLDTLAKARSRDDLVQIKDFADTIAKGSEEEQLIFAKAFDKAPDALARAELNKAAKEILEIDASDPVRRKLVSIVEQISDLPPDRQAEGYRRTAQVANVYRTTDDPALKAALADAIMKATSPDDIIKLGEMLDLIAVGDSLGGLSTADKIAVISGQDPELIDRLKAAQVLLAENNRDEAQKAKDGELSASRIQDILSRSVASGPGGVAGGKVSVETLKANVAARQNLLTEKEKVQREIANLLADGVAPDDDRIVNLYKRLSEINDELAKIDAMLAGIRSRLKDYLSKIKERAISDFKDAGVSVPDFDLGIPMDSILDNSPAERLSNLQDYSEFWGSDAYGVKKNQHTVYKFSSSSGGGTGILEKISDEKQGREWYVNNYGGGVVGSVDGNREFTMSKTIIIPGILRRIPVSGIPSGNSTQYTIYFEFLVSVANRKTGKIEIPAGSWAICKPKAVDVDSSRMSADCDSVDVGGREDIRVSLSLGDPLGADGVPGLIVDNRGWQLAGIFLTAFSAAVLDGYSQTVVAPFEQKATKTAADFATLGVTSGSSKILQDVASKQVENWTKASVWWHSYDGALATIKQK